MIKKTAMLLIGAILIVSVLTSGCTSNVVNTTPSPTSTTSTSTTTYTSTAMYTSAYGYSIKYTSDWGKPEEQDKGADVVFLTPTKNETDRLLVHVENLTANDTLATLTGTYMAIAQKYDDFKLIEAANTTLAGNPASKIVYSATIGVPQKVLQTWTVKNGKAYFIDYKGEPSDYDTYLSAAQQMIDSFQIQ